MKQLHRFENALSIFALLAMAILPLAEIAIRWFYSGGIPGAVIWIQHLTLWLCFLGAAIAAREGELIALGAGSAWLRGRWGAASSVFVAGTGLAICAVLARGGWALVEVERQGGRVLALGLPVWVAELVIPAGLAVIGLRLWWRGGSNWRARAAAASFLLVPLALTWVEDPGESVWTLPLLALLIAAMMLGLPIFAGLGGIAAVLLWQNYDPISAIPLEAYNLSVKPMLPTLPLFTLAGYILAEGGTPRRLVDLFRAFFGWMPGGVAVVSIAVCAFFTSFTGGSGVTILAMGGLLFPMLIRDGQNERFSTGLLTSAGSLGLLFPPSLAVILYGLVAELEIKRLFLGGLIPGLIETLLVAGFVLYYSKKTGIERIRFQKREALEAFWRAKWEIAIPFVVLGSILGGFATLVEAAAITVLYAFFLEFILHRNLSVRRDLARVSLRAATLIGGVLIILGIALGLTNYLVIAEIPSLALDWVASFVTSPLLFLLLFNLFLILVGCVMDIYSAIVVVVPLLAPLDRHFGIDPYHLGIVFLVNLELGYLTPPVGMNLFLASHRFGQPLTLVYRASLPFLGIRAVAVLLITYLPWLTLWLPSLF